MYQGYKDTIIAISTPPGIGAISIVRLSGSLSHHIVKKIFKAKKDPIYPRVATFGRVTDNGQPIDDVIVIFYKAPHSYTGEDMVEINCHGNPYIANRIIELCTKNGARLAEPGEFTKRAFLNGKLELTQAEAVADLINSLTKISNETSLKILEGKLGNKLENIKKKLIDLISLIEIELDFQEENIETISRKELLKKISETKREIERLTESYEYGKIAQHGITVAIVGPPNSGKSTLLNSFLKKERAITSPIPGTTRDYIEESISIKGYLLKLIDTAGIRQTHDDIEKAGIEQSYKIANSSDTVLFVVDITNPGDIRFAIEEKNIKIDNVIFVLNKTDKVKKDKICDIEKFFNGKTYALISAKTGKGVHELGVKIIESIETKKKPQADIIITNQRHYKELKNARKSLKSALRLIKDNMPAELISSELRFCLEHIDRITGKTTSDDILNNIFSKFCIGK
ncbi:MAG: tRNA uridine-5-carboxymethylaminomethyl(34) synthesis GTPase MnmE [Candidatus Marinimicrobia bacterium]|nr:tRNA uridine-5-carboxymethylaminomethyl(34) synthesis GTPase MnmE [Candidatus Neomarinimicrobiota bacterium]